MNSLPQLLDAMHAHGSSRFYWKALAPNDNSKNQIYFGGDFSILNTIPAEAPFPAESGSHRAPIFKAPLRLEWLDHDGRAHEARGAQFILYPQYPEVRLSGFLRGARHAPSAELRSRAPGRVLVIGIAPGGRVLAYAAFADTPIAAQLHGSPSTEAEGVLRTLARTSNEEQPARRHRLLAELCRVHSLGWIDAWRLGAKGERTSCNAPHCIGVTLESELGVAANSSSEPDFEGWEVKAYGVSSLTRTHSGRLTLLTPEPTGGVYRHDGVEQFVQRYGYPDKRGRPNRRNFGGIHRVGSRTASTGLRTVLDGYDVPSGKLINTDGAVRLIDDDDVVAAEWSFASLLDHWSRKHARAVFVPALTDKGPERRRYRYGPNVVLAVGTDYLRFLAGLADGSVFLDPGVKVVTTGNVVMTKKRSQFRSAFGSLSRLYQKFESVSSCSVSPA